MVSSGSYSNLLDNFLCSFQAACGLQIRSLIDVTSEALVDMIIGKTPEEIHKMFNMKQDLTLEDVVEVFEMDDWCFE
ncbi:SKP1-like protein 1B [Tanacetum coccineum]|uniref:SKP1-like protein 1B n=1 Tax=Tanacetum coccineum TaxID=301880 RepID=A0ABQ5FR92_9ASTR